MQSQQVQMRNGMVIQQQHENGMNGSSVVAMGNGGGGQQQQKVLRENLHFAADSVSNAMSSLVRELNTGAGSLLSFFLFSRHFFCSVLFPLRSVMEKPVGISPYYT